MTPLPTDREDWSGRVDFSSKTPPPFQPRELIVSVTAQVTPGSRVADLVREDMERAMRQMNDILLTGIYRSEREMFSSISYPSVPWWRRWAHASAEYVRGIGRALANKSTDEQDDWE